MDMATLAKGTFDIKMLPLPAQDDVGDPAIGRMALDKQYHGDLDGVGKGLMLAMGTAVDGSAGYVAMERVVGSVHGRHGSFALQHCGVMNRGTPRLSIAIVPDSGAEALAGIAGTLEIVIAEGKHTYALSYTLPDTA
ncbi:DUF3224 domain-containing protein [Dyella silvae]|uniref:DUF3224 domain-containing protein n=1 Tax=Dyella silvae TaxID=2994424 RepID=UPI002B277614|nr:DUF3224 domain-containing protein [Dyella silvae]